MLLMSDYYNLYSSMAFTARKITLNQLYDEILQDVVFVDI